MNSHTRTPGKMITAATSASMLLLLAACAGFGQQTGEVPTQAPVTITETATPTEAESEAETTEYEAESETAEDSTSASYSDDEDVPASVVGDDPNLFRLGTTEPGPGTAENITIEATSKQENAGGFKDAFVTVLKNQANGVLQYPMIDGAATVYLNMKFPNQTVETCQASIEVYDADGKETNRADTHFERKGDNKCHIGGGNSVHTGMAYAEFTQLGEYYIVVEAQQADYEPIRIAQKVLVTAGSDARG